MIFLSQGTAGVWYKGPPSKGLNSLKLQIYSHPSPPALVPQNSELNRNFFTKLKYQYILNPFLYNHAPQESEAEPYKEDSTQILPLGRKLLTIFLREKTLGESINFDQISGSLTLRPLSHLIAYSFLKLKASLFLLSS